MSAIQKDNCETILEEAHKIFGKTSVFAVFDMDRETCQGDLVRVL